MEPKELHHEKGLNGWSEVSIFEGRIFSRRVFEATTISAVASSNNNANPKVSDSRAAMKFEFCMLKYTTQADF